MSMSTPRSVDRRLARLTKRAQQGDPRAFQALYRALYPIVSRYVSRRLADRVDAEDVVAHVFERLTERLSEINQRKGGALAFACGIARNRMIDILRARKPGVRLQDVVDELIDPRTPLSELLEHEERVTVSRCVADLAPQLREMFALRYSDGLSCAAIAELTGLPEAVVRQRFSRALRELRHRMRSLVSGPQLAAAGECTP